MSDTSDMSETAAAPDRDGWEWVRVEIFGHRSHWGRSREEERFGTKMLRIDVPIEGNPAAKGWATFFYGGSAIFSYTLTDEASCMRANKPYERPARLALPEPDDDGDFTGDEDS